MKYVAKAILTIAISLFLFVVASPEVTAQSCSGQITCCQEVSNVCTDGLGNSCVPGPGNPGCQCTPSCTNWDLPQNCSFQSGVCGVSFGCGLAQGGCNYTPPASTPAPSSAPTAPPNGACGSCNTCGAPQNECALINGVCSKAGYCSGSVDPTNCSGYIWSNSSYYGPEFPPNMYVTDYGPGGAPSGVNPYLTAQVVLTSGHTIQNVEWSIQNAPPYCFGGQGSCSGATCNYIAAQSGSVNNNECNGWGSDDTPQNALRAFVTATNGGSCAIATSVYVRPYCDLQVPSSLNVRVGESIVLTPQTTATGSYDVRFSSASPAIATVSPSVDGTSPFQTSVTGVSTGTTTVRVTTYLSLHSWRSCVKDVTINVIEPTPWWQVVGGNVTSGGSLQSLIPESCTPAVGCNPYLIDNPTTGAPGIAVYGAGRTIDLDDGEVSQNPPYGWVSSTQTTGSDYDYDYAYSLLPSDWEWNDIAATTYNGNLNSGTAASDGYIYQRVTVNPGNQTFNLNSAQLISNKVILFVDGNLNINNSINLSGGGSFFMAIVSGDIRIDPSVGGATPALEGIYLSENFATGTGNNKLIINGSVVGYTSINLGRDLESSNETESAEEFRQNPRLQLLFPATLTKDTIIWEEVAP